MGSGKPEVQRCQVGKATGPVLLFSSDPPVQPVRAILAVGKAKAMQGRHVGKWERVALAKGPVGQLQARQTCQAGQANGHAASCTTRQDLCQAQCPAQSLDMQGPQQPPLCKAHMHTCAAEFQAPQASDVVQAINAVRRPIRC